MSDEVPEISTEQKDEFFLKVAQLAGHYGITSAVMAVSFVGGTSSSTGMGPFQLPLAQQLLDMVTRKPQPN